MRYKASFIFLVVVFALIALNQVSGEIPSRNYGFDVSITGEQNNPGVFQAKLTITDLASSKVVAAPIIRFHAGQPAESSIAADKDNVSFRFSVSVNNDGSAANYQIQVMNGPTIISQSKANISLPR